MDVPLRKVTARVDLKPASPRRPPSPTKNLPASPSPSSLRLKAKVNTDAATVRKLSSSSSLYSSKPRNAPPPSRSRPGSPFKPSRALPNGSESSTSPKARVMTGPASRSRMSPVQLNSSLEPRQRALTTASAKLKLPHLEDRPRSGSVIALHHAVSLSDIGTSASPTLPRPPLSAGPPLIGTRRTNTPPILAPIKIKSRVTDLVKATSTDPGDAASRSLSPPYATTRPIHARARAPSITSSFSLNDPPTSTFYPITAASPAANPHRYVPLRAPSPVRSYPSPTLPSEPQPTRKPVLVPKVDPTLIPLPPHSPSISALSLSSKSSVSRTSASLNTDQTSDNQTSSVLSHIKRHSMDRIGQPSPFFSQADIKAQTRRNRSRSRERSPLHQGDSDVESDGSERQLRAEAKTNRKIADLEITNRSLLAINASLETTKNRQAKEIRDLRRKLRESRLILPPMTYSAVKSALEDDRDDEDECNDESDVEEGDETFQRVRGLIDSLVESCKSALETRSEDFRASSATKVLNADELRSWRDSGQHTLMSINYMDTHDADDKTIQGLLSPALAAMPDSDSTSIESDGEPASDSRGPTVLPPITITHSL